MAWTEATLDSAGLGFDEPSTAPPDEWRVLIDGQLAEWERDPEALADEGIEPPSAATVRLAIRMARAAKKAGEPPPSKVVVDGVGGIAFERLAGGVYETMLVRKDGSVESFVFRGAEMLSRRRLREAGPVEDRP